MAGVDMRCVDWVWVDMRIKRCTLRVDISDRCRYSEA